MSSAQFVFRNYAPDTNHNNFANRIPKVVVYFLIGILINERKNLRFDHVATLRRVLHSDSIAAKLFIDVDIGNWTLRNESLLQALL